MASQKRACVIGAGGASGVAALTQLRAHSISAKGYEMRSAAGGAWLSDASPGECLISIDENGRVKAETERFKREGERGKGTDPTPMYSGLRTNLPKVIYSSGSIRVTAMSAGANPRNETEQALMAFLDTPFGTDGPSFPPPDVVCDYIADAAEGLPIQFDTKVVRLFHSPSPTSRRWTVESISTLKDGPVVVEEFDYVVVANGHFEKAWIPQIEGLKTWWGKLLHSRWYRAPTFDQGNVLVVGNSASGYDIAREFATKIHSYRKDQPGTTLPKIYQSARSPIDIAEPFDATDAPEWAQEISVYPPISSIDGKRIRFEDGRTLDDVDTIIFATGYLYSFPFAQSVDAPWKKAPLTNDEYGGFRVENLDERQIFYLPDPTLALVGLNTQVVPLALSQIQSKLIAAYWSSSISLSFTQNTCLGDRHVYSHPYEFDVRDQLLAEINSGEGVGESPWVKTPEWMRKMRREVKALRRLELGH